MENELTLTEILYWIVDNQDDTEAMDRISRTTFPFTSKYMSYTERKDRYGNSVS